MKGCSQGVMLRSPRGSVGSVGAAWGEEAGIHVGDGGTGGGAGRCWIRSRVTGGEVTGCGGRASERSGPGVNPASPHGETGDPEGRVRTEGRDGGDASG